MGSALTFLTILVIGLAAYFLARARAAAVVDGDIRKLHSRPVYFGSYAAILSILPASLVLIAGLVIGAGVVENSIRSSLPAEVLAKPQSEQNVAYQMVSAIADGLARMTPAETATVSSDITQLKAVLGSKGVPLAQQPQPYMVDAAQHLMNMAGTTSLIVGLVSISVALAGAYFALSRVSQTYRARNRVETIMLSALVISSTIAILTTFGIIGSLVTETYHFFSVVSPLNFFFGTVWDPRFSTDGNSVGQFGLIPLLLGTLYIALVAMLIAVPIGLFAAIYMAEYASRRVRSIVKPLLEILAGIPTIVYGFFALITIGPLFRDFSASLWGALTGNHTNFIEAQSVLVAGFVMSIRLIPFVSSLSDDIITAVPRAMRDGSLGLGATRSETMKRVILPAALPGIMGALLLTASRAIGETMIVVLAAGVAANLQFSPFQPMTTITVKIVNQLTGDLEFNSPQTLVAFALGITLFVITLALNIYALYIVRKYREQYE
ncbi:phosphate ABC transporter permease subunit PstC [Rhizobium sp. KVB221]|uniref:Phosphate transport system permease protein n=1 Tax=Rhizobium setariae TaxID=2801340 RepID=A0A936YSB5_9HYPH|nr:phosphate ABC transporter permease subunit PstC [Rhizobium setariae]MBL0371490.1 phosphate ABC transporter permease subunit PstC [Rhizobium setariae]